MAMSALFTSAHKQNVFRVCVLRTLYLLAIMLSLLTNNTASNLLPGLLITLLLLFLINIASYFFLLKTQHVSENMLLLQLLIDIFGVYFLLYFYGGFSNPFISYLLVPVTIAAATLSRNKVLLVFISAVCVYSVLMLPFYFHDPNPHMPHHGESNAFSSHLIGMWLNFILSATLLSVFLERMSNSMKKKEQEINAQKEALALNEQIVALGTFAADAAHELSTPLATMAITIHEMQNNLSNHPDIQEDLGLLRNQIDRCKKILTSFTEKTGFSRLESFQNIALGHFIQQHIHEIQRNHPLKSLTFNNELSTDINITHHTAFLNGLKNILNNAAQASAKQVKVTLQLVNEQVIFTCINDGEDITQLDQNKISTPFYSSKEHGLGLGLFLAKMATSQLNGDLKWSSARKGGTVMVLTIPLLSLTQATP